MLTEDAVRARIQAAFAEVGPDPSLRPRVIASTAVGRREAGHSRLWAIGGAAVVLLAVVIAVLLLVRPAA